MLVNNFVDSLKLMVALGGGQNCQKIVVSSR